MRRVYIVFCTHTSQPRPPPYAGMPAQRKARPAHLAGDLGRETSEMMEKMVSQLLDEDPSNVFPLPSADVLEHMVQVCWERVKGRPLEMMRRTELGIALRDALGPEYQRGWVNLALRELEHRGLGCLTPNGRFFRIVTKSPRYEEAAGTLDMEQEGRKRAFLLMDGDDYYNRVQMQVRQSRMSTYAMDLVPMVQRLQMPKGKVGSTSSSSGSGSGSEDKGRDGTDSGEVGGGGRPRRSCNRWCHFGHACKYFEDMEAHALHFQNYQHLCQDNLQCPFVLDYAAHRDTEEGKAHFAMWKHSCPNGGLDCPYLANPHKHRWHMEFYTHKSKILNAAAAAAAVHE